jgi:hypothetical protein
LRCRSNGGGNGKNNISYVKESEHRAWHLLFRNYTAHQIAEIINEHWIDPAFQLVVAPRNAKVQLSFKLE